jgi:hypothetical protein
MRNRHREAASAAVATQPAGIGLVSPAPGLRRFARHDGGFNGEGLQVSLWGEWEWNYSSLQMI